jgi:hypothetical protein
VHACSTRSVTAVTCDLYFVGTSILAQLTAVIIVRLCRTFARRMCALLCFRYIWTRSSAVPEGEIKSVGLVRSHNAR